MALIGLTATPAVGALTTRCVGFASDVTVPGDLVVPANASCSLINVKIDGSVRVARGADLVLDLDSSVAGDVRVATGGFVDATESSIGGTLIGRSVFAASLEGSSVGGDARFVGSDEDAGGPGLVSIESSDVAGSFRARDGEVSIESSRIVGDLRANGATFLDIVDSTVDGGLHVQNTEFGMFVCASEVYGPSVVHSNAYGVQLGRGGQLGQCDGASFWGDDVTVRDNDAPEIGVILSDNIVAGSLRGSGNSPAPVGDANRVRGDVAGQFVDLGPLPGTETPAPAPEPAPDEPVPTGEPTPPPVVVGAREAAVARFEQTTVDQDTTPETSGTETTDAASTIEVSTVEADVTAEAGDIVEQRRDAALAAATAAGPANL